MKVVHKSEKAKKVRSSLNPHQCNVCEELGLWTDDWAWVAIVNLKERIPHEGIFKTCSDQCRKNSKQAFVQACGRNQIGKTQAEKQWEERKLSEVL